MPRLSPEEGAAKYVRKATAASSDYSSGIDRVTRAPAQAAIAARARWEAKMNDAATREKWARNTGATTLEEWRSAAKGKGASNYSGGVQAAEGKVAARNRELYSHIAAGEARVNAMPNVTLQDGINRATAMIQHMANYRRGGGGR
jgi:hypothetical protein